jgi:hypothetical protein
VSASEGWIGTQLSAGARSMPDGPGGDSFNEHHDSGAVDR